MPKMSFSSKMGIMVTISQGRLGLTCVKYWSHSFYRPVVRDVSLLAIIRLAVRCHLLRYKVKLSGPAITFVLPYR